MRRWALPDPCHHQDESQPAARGPTTLPEPNNSEPTLEDYEACFAPKPIYLDVLRSCAYCNVLAELSKHCNQDCLGAHWKEHKKVCAPCHAAASQSTTRLTSQRCSRRPRRSKTTAGNTAASGDREKITAVLKLEVVMRPTRQNQNVLAATLDQAEERRFAGKSNG